MAQKYLVVWDCDDVMALWRDCEEVKGYIDVGYIVEGSAAVGAANYYSNVHYQCIVVGGDVDTHKGIVDSSSSIMEDSGYNMRFDGIVGNPFVENAVDLFWSC